MNNIVLRATADSSSVIRSAGEAFLQGELAMDPAGPAELAASPPLWGESLINCGLVSVTIVLAILCLSNIIEIFPIVVAGIFRTKPVMRFENNIRLGRERDQVAGVAFLAVCLIFAKYDVISLRFMEKFSAGISTLTVIGIMAAYLLVRGLLIFLLEPMRRGKEYYVASNHIFFNFVILSTVLMAMTVLGCSLMDINDLAVRKILLYEISGVGLFFAARKLDIMSNFCNLFFGILYLCVLEFFPVGLLIAATLLF